MKSLYFLLLLGFSFLPAKGQVYKVILTNELLKDPLTQIKVEEIIDNRIFKSKIGYTYSGLSNKKVMAEFEKPFEEELKLFFDRNTVAFANAIPVAIKINKLGITERYNTQYEIATAEVHFELLTKKDGNYYKIGSFGGFSESTAMDVKYSHDENITKAFDICFDQLKRMNLEVRLKSAEPLSLADLQENPYYTINPTSIPALRSDTLAYGVYRTFAEFKNNTPGLKDKLIIQKNGTAVKAISGKKVTNAWGFNAGTGPMVFYGNKYYPLRKQSDHFTFTAELTTLNNGAILAGGLMGGLVGAAVVAAMTTEKNQIDLVLNMMTGAVTEPDQYGPVVDLDEVPMKDEDKTAKIIFYRNIRAESTEPLNIYIKDSLYAQIQPNSYTEIILKGPLADTEVCLKNNKNACIKFTPAIHQPNYVKCSQPAKNGESPEIEVTSAKEGLYYLKLINSLQKEKTKS